MDKNVLAILRYVGAPIHDPTTSRALLTPSSGNPVIDAKGPAPLKEYQLAVCLGLILVTLRLTLSHQTLVNPGAPGGNAPADHVIDLEFGSVSRIRHSQRALF